MRLIFLLVEEKIFFGRVVRPYIFYAFVNFAIVLKFLKILDHLFRRTGTIGIINEFVFRGRPRSIVQAAGKFKCPIHIKNVLSFC